MKKHILNVSTAALRGLAYILSAAICLLNILYHVTVSYNSHESVSIEYGIWTGLAILVLLAAAFFALVMLKSSLVKISEKKLFLILSLLYSVMALYLILNIDLKIRADAQSVSNAAQKLLEGNLDAFAKGGYLNQYPHQAGLMLYDALLYLFSKNIAIQFIANFLLVLGTNYLLYRITDRLFGNHLTNLLAIVLSFAFLPQFFFILFAYGNIPSFFFLALAFYHTLRFTGEHRLQNLVVVFLSAAVAVLLRKNCMIGVVAIGICLLLDMLKKYTHKHLLLILLLAAGMILPSNLVSSYFLQKADVQEAGSPTVLWVAMGTDIDNNTRGPGWYNSFNYSAFKKAVGDPQRAHEIGMAKLTENADKIKQEPAKALSFFSRKIISQWCEPVFQSVWSGPLESCGQNTHTALLQSLYNGEKAEAVLAFFCRALVVALWGLAVLFLVENRQGESGWELFFLFMIGGFLFHIVWEAKSQYIYQYVLVLVPFSAQALSRKLQTFHFRSKRS